MSSKEGPCEYCEQTGDLIADIGEGDLTEPLYICKKCNNLLKDPVTALPLIRGNLSFESRKGQLKSEQINKFMTMIGGWHKLH